MGLVSVHFTCANQREADKIAKALVSERLAACVQMVPIRSVYRWKQKVERAEEVLMLAKTKTSLCPAVVKRVRELHSYELPAIFVVPVDAPLDVERWVRGETK